MLRKACAAIAAAAIMVMAFAVSSADAKKSKKGRPDRQETTTFAPSLDSRVTGRARTCGHDTLLYDSNGMPYGPIATDGRASSARA